MVWIRFWIKHALISFLTARTSSWDFCTSCNLLSYQDCDDIGDVARKKDVDKALRGADCVFHLASYGMSGKEMLQFGRVDEVNINGTFLFWRLVSSLRSEGLFMWAHMVLYSVERRLWMAMKAYLSFLLMTMLIHTAVANQLLNGWFWSTMLVLSSKLMFFKNPHSCYAYLYFVIW